MLADDLLNAVEGGKESVQVFLMAFFADVAQLKTTSYETFFVVLD